MIRMNPYRYNAPPHWNPIDTAPKDGTVIEIQNNWGVAPHFGLVRWSNGGWKDANNPNSGHSDGPHLSWRPYSGDSSNYCDPTGGAQYTRAYWLQACGYNPRDYPGSELSFEEEAERDRQLADIPSTHNKPGVLERVCDWLGL